MFCLTKGDFRYAARRRSSPYFTATLAQLTPATIGGATFHVCTRNPERSVPCLRRRIALLTDFCAPLPYLGIVSTPFGGTQARWLFVSALPKTSIIARLNAGISSGFRAETSLPSTTASLSIHYAPAFFKSVFRDGQAAIFRPLAAPASMIVQGPWQIAATGLPAVKK